MIALGARYAETCKPGSGGGSAETAAETQYGATVPTSRIKRFFSLFLAIVMMAGLLTVNAHSTNSNKITYYGSTYGHWDYEVLTLAVGNGMMVGTFEDKLNTDGYLPRAQMAAMVD